MTPQGYLCFFPVSQVPLLAQIWYIKIYHLSVLLLSFIALFIFTRSHQTLLFLCFLYFFSPEATFSLSYVWHWTFIFGGEKMSVLSFYQSGLRWDFNIYSKVLPLDFAILWKPSIGCNLDREINDWSSFREQLVSDGLTRLWRSSECPSSASKA